MKKTNEPFTLHQLFNLKMKTLERRFKKVYAEKRDPDMMVQLVYILQIRQRLVAHSVECPCRQLIRDIYQTQRIRRKLKRYIYFFQTYFTAEEWEKLLAKIVVSVHQLVRVIEQWANSFLRCIQTPIQVLNNYLRQKPRIAVEAAMVKKNKKMRGGGRDLKIYLD